MSFDRADLIAKLKTLGDDDDAAALDAARAIAAMNVDWSTALAAEKGGKKKAAKSALSGDVGKTIANLLARDDLSDDTREDLETFQKDHEGDRLDPADAEYVQALAGRLA